MKDFEKCAQKTSNLSDKYFIVEAENVNIFWQAKY